MSPGAKKVYISAGILLAMVLAAIGGLLVSPTDAPLVVSLLVGSVWGAGLIARAVAGSDAWRTAWIIGCVIGVAAATTSMASSASAFAAGALITLAIAAVGIWTINHRIGPTPASR